MHAVLAVPLSSIFNVNFSTPALFVDNSKALLFSAENLVINKQKGKKLNSSFRQLHQHKVLYPVNHLINITNEHNQILDLSLVNSMLKQVFEIQKCVHSNIQAQQNAFFEGQASFQAERQKLASHIYKFN